MIDETGNQYGYLSVIKISEKRTRNRQICWECLCKCGKTVIIDGSNLRRGNSKSCGCLNKEKNNLNRINKSKKSISLIGKKFGKLTVIKLTEERNCGNVKYLCECECGSKVIIAGNHLKTGNTTSCGCTRSKGELEISQLLIKNNIEFKKEFSFNNLLSQTGVKLRFDFAIFKNEKLLYLIEYQGKQHFETGSGWNTEEKLTKTTEHDNLKREYCKKENIPLIEIPFTLLGRITLKDLELK